MVLIRKGSGKAERAEGHHHGAIEGLERLIRNMKNEINGIGNKEIQNVIDQLLDDPSHETVMQHISRICPQRQNSPCKNSIQKERA